MLLSEQVVWTIDLSYHIQLHTYVFQALQICYYYIHTCIRSIIAYNIYTP